MPGRRETGPASTADVQGDTSRAFHLLFTALPPPQKATPRIDFHSDKDAVVLLVDRGPTGPGFEPCKFAEKVWNAQQAGARAVLVANYEDQLTTMEAPDDDDEAEHKYLANITGAGRDGRLEEGGAGRSASLGCDARRVSVTPCFEPADTRLL